MKRRSTDLIKLSTKPSHKIITSTTTPTHSSKEKLAIPPSDILNAKIENITEGLSSDCFNLLYNKVLPASRDTENTLTICNYISSLKSEINLSDNYRKNNIDLLGTFSIFFKNKSFKEITRERLTLQ
jgi:hypothetical protein